MTIAAIAFAAIAALWAIGLRADLREAPKNKMSYGVSQSFDDGQRGAWYNHAPYRFTLGVTHSVGLVLHAPIAVLKALRAL